MIYRFYVYGGWGYRLHVRNTALPLAVCGKNAHVVPLHVDETNGTSPGEVSNLIVGHPVLLFQLPNVSDSREALLYANQRLHKDTAAAVHGGTAVFIDFGVINVSTFLARIKNFHASLIHRGTALEL